MAPARDVATLLEALPYIREFHGRTVVIKYGGAAMEDPALREEFARDVVLLKYVGLNPVVIHGGGPEITSYMERLQMPVEFVGGLRVSDEATVEVAKMVLVGKVNKDIVLRLNRHGQPAVGLCGDDGLLFRVATQKGPEGEDVGFVGRIERVNTDVIDHIAQDYIPVIASVGADREGHSHNVNADEAAGAVARAMRAYKVMFLTDVPGWLRDPADPSSVVSEATASEVVAALDSVAGGMRPKLQACVDALHGGVTFAHIVDGREPHSLLLELLHRRRRRHQDPAVSLLNTYARYDVRFERGAGARLWDDAGNEYLDFLCGISVSSVGHCHPAVVEAIREQAGRLMHVGNLFYTEPMERAGDRLTGLFGGGGGVFFTNSGAEAVEAALKLARKARQGGDVIVAQGAFHGRTYGALSATPQESKQAPFAPLVPGFRALEPEAIADSVDERTACVLLEPVQGETRRPRAVRRGPARVSRGLRPAWRGADLRRDPERPGAHRQGLGARVGRRRARRADDREGPRRRPADRRPGHRPAVARRAGAGRPRLDVRRWRRRGGGGERRAGRADRPGAAAPRVELGERLVPRLASSRTCSTCAGWA